MNIHDTVIAQREYFLSAATLGIDFRKRMLQALLDALDKYEEELYSALWTDLHKSREEAYMTEISIVRGEIRDALKNIGRWTARKRVRTPLTCLPSMSYIVTEPLGVALIVAPWNYPVQLLLNPLVGAIAAGCTAVLKTSPSVPAVAEVLRKMIEETFEPRYIALFQGHREVNEELLKEKYDLIFLTGSPSLGKVAMRAAAENLTPVVLELGGKSPCIVDKDADIALAARRIAWGKSLNCGQTCIAPDYLMLSQEIKQQFIDEFAKAVEELYGSSIKDSPHYVRIVSEKAFDRLGTYLKDGEIIYGGERDRDARFFGPTLLDDVAPDSSVMTEEIFGPIFPIMTFASREEVIDFINARPKPLALYYFGKRSAGREILRRTSSGGACINDTIMHIANSSLPFGGVGNSGIGRYHGRESLLAFSHRRSVLDTPTCMDLPLRYMPYRLFPLIKKLLR